MLTVKSSAIATLALVGASVGAYSLWDNNNNNDNNNVHVEESARELQEIVAAVIEQDAAVVEEEPRMSRHLQGIPPCPEFGSCCSSPVPVRRGLRQKNNFVADVADPAAKAVQEEEQQQQRELQLGNGSCETAYALFNPNGLAGPVMDDATNQCFITEGFSRWGWRISIDATSASTTTYPVYGGAGQCDISKGEEVGTLTVAYDPANGGTCTGTMNTNSFHDLGEMQFYCGTAHYPTQGQGFSVAPGKASQSGCVTEYSSNVDSATCTAQGVAPDAYGLVHVQAHYVACGNGGTGTDTGTPTSSPTESPTSSPTGSPPREEDYCEEKTNCVSPTEYCSSFGYTLCGDSCCDSGTFKFIVDQQCESDGSSWCPEDCGDDGAVFGDPHFRTWHHQHEFEYHGECDLVFLKAPTMEMDIHVRTTIRYDYSYVSQAAVRIGDEIFEVASWGEYQLDGMSSVDLPAFIGGFPITRSVADDGLKVKFVIRLDDDQDIRITSYKDYVSVRIDNGTMAMYEGASGIMGDYETGSMFLRDGTIESDPNVYAPEWQVRPKEDGVLFAGERAPVYPQRCVMPSANAIGARDRKLGAAAVSREQAQAACAGRSAEDQASCMEDVIKTQDLDIANAD